MNREIKFRGQEIDTKEWIYGYYTVIGMTHYISKQIEEDPKYYDVNVISETVGQLQYTSPKGVEYYDGDIYYHAGYGKETVSNLCELQMALISGNADDIGEVIGNIYSNPINSI